MNKVNFQLYCLILFGIISFTACFPQPKYEEEVVKERLDKVGYGSPDWLATLDSIIAEYPTEAWAYYRKGLQLIRKDNYIEGIPYVNRAAALDPYMYANYTGLTKLFIGDYEGALENFKIAIKYNNHIDIITPGSAYTRIGIAHKEMGDYKTALTTFDDYVERFGEDDVDLYVFMHRGLTKIELGDYDGATADFDTIIRKWEKCPEAYYHKGVINHKKGNNALACKQFKKALLYKNYIRSSPNGSYIDQLYLADIESMFDLTCR